MSDSDADGPAPVDDGCGLLPHVPRELVASVIVSRLMQDGEGRIAVFTLPKRFSADADEITVAEYAGGGMFRAQARDSKGRFLKGYDAREFYLEGPAKDVDGAAPPGDAQPPAPPAPPPPAVPAPFASLGVPIASPLPGMPTVSLDIPGMPPEVRAWLQVYAASQAYTFQAITRGTELAVESARRGADAEREAARHAVGMATEYVGKVSGPALANQGKAIDALGTELATVRAELVTERAEHGRTREKWHGVAVENAMYRALLESGGQMPARDSPGWRGFVERMAAMLVGTMGPQFAALVAGQLGLKPDEFKALTAVAGAAEGRPANGATS